MENTLLVGLSRQMVLERQMDVVANNVANVNTNGFKADRSLFEEYLRSPAHEDNFQRTDRRVVVRAGPRHLQGFRGRHQRADQEPARRRDRRQGFPGGADPCRRALHPRRQPADQQSGPARHRRRQSRARQAPARSCSSRPTSRSTSPPTATSPCSRAPAASIRFAASCASFHSRTRRSSSRKAAILYSAGQGVAAQPDTTSRVRQGYVEKSNVNSVTEMSRMIEITRAYTQISALLQQQSDLHKSAIEKLAEVPA